MKPCCPLCRAEAKIYVGSALFPRSPWLHSKLFWACIPCGTRVGCHDGTETALGTLADAKTRKLRMLVHETFDPVWRARKCRFEGQRSKAYAWLAMELGMDVGDCHIGNMDAATCLRAVATIELADAIGALKRSEKAAA